jgi:electron transfer flavoprotein alpha subunit
MAKILVISELNNDKVKGVTLEILGKIQGHHAEVVIVGDAPQNAISDLAKFGAKKVHSLKGNGLSNYSPEGYAKVLSELIKNEKYEFVFSGATSIGKDLMPRLAGSFNSGLASDVVNFIFEGDKFSATRPLFAGKCLAKVEIKESNPKFITVRPNALGLPASAPAAGPAEKLEHNMDAGSLRATIKEILKGASGKLDLTEANIIVSGGRAMGSAANFKVLEPLAEVLGATVGASRAAVDSGYAPHAMQVGQTGKTVAPTLYIACGISGAIQHLAGMRTSKVIIAINTDKDAPIFTKADYGIVGDLFKIVPILTEELKNLLGK